ncbi:MAG: DUF533 domain-containing protein [Hyphomicrobiaceae bacterium]|nr:DUF533 domain-containing protein [Hyphomicrobiaceae bacterium]
MFDAKSLLESLLNGPGQRGHAPGGQGAAGSGQQPDSGNPLLDAIGNMMAGGGSQRDGAPSAGADNPLADLLERFGAGGAGGSGEPGQPGAGGNIMDVLGQVLNQATTGVREGAGRIDEATGAGAQLRDLTQNMSGKTPEEIMATVKDLIANNQLGAGAALGGLGALILGTETGRSVAVGAAKAGALALIAGLAYKAYTNYQQGKPPLDVAGQGRTGGVTPPPAGSGFEPAAVSNEQAERLIRAMIAAAAADGRIDETEQQKIIANLKLGGLDGQAEEFLARELNAPATVEQLASGLTGREQAVQVYTAARVAIDPDTSAEQTFLANLAKRLGLDDALVRHIDASARAAA